MSEDRCGVPRLISRLPMLGGPLLLERRRWLDEGLDDTLDGVLWLVVAGSRALNSSGDSVGSSSPLKSAAVVAPTTSPDDALAEELRRLPKRLATGDEDVDAAEQLGSEGWRLRSRDLRCGDWWCALEADGDPKTGVGGCVGGSPTEMEEDLRMLRSPLVGFSGYYRPAMRTQFRFESPLLDQMPVVVVRVVVLVVG